MANGLGSDLARVGAAVFAGKAGENRKEDEKEILHGVKSTLPKSN